LLQLLCDLVWWCENAFVNCSGSRSSIYLQRPQTAASSRGQ